jgi:hypothetical protein
MTSNPHLIKAILASPLGTLLAAVVFSPWLLYQYTSASPFAPGALPVVAKIAALWGIAGYFVALVVVATYGLAAHALLSRHGKTALGWYLLVGALPGVLLAATPLAYQESVVPGVLFGVVVFALFWRIAVRPSLAANNSSKPTPLRGAA